MSVIVETASVALTAERLDEITKGLRYRQPERVIGALWPLAQQYGMSRLARDTGISRAHLYRIFGDMRNPELNTLLQLFNVFGVNISATMGGDTAKSS
jgi:probable addiction module antidote protein